MIPRVGWRLAQRHVRVLIRLEVSRKNTMPDSDADASIFPHSGEKFSAPLLICKWLIVLRYKRKKRLTIHHL